MVDMFWLVYLFLFGITVGSFLNVIMYRWPRGEGFVRGRSFCPKCKKILQWYDLVPLFSWLTLGGRCRYCGKSISVQYPLVELLNGLGWLGIGWLAINEVVLGGLGSVGFEGLELVNLVFLLLLYSTILVIIGIDALHQLIPDEASILIGVLGVVLGLLTGTLFWERLAWAVGAAGFFGALYLITKGKGMGLGDVKLAGAMGLLLGNLTGLALVFAFFSGAVVGMFLLLLQRAQMKQAIAFGPFMVLGLMVAMLWGERIMEWYLGMWWVY